MPRTRPGRVPGAVAVILLLLTLLAWFSHAAFAADAKKFPEPKGYVNDYAGVIDQTSASQLDAELKSLEDRTSAQIAVVTVPDIEGYADIDEYGVELFKAWGIGQKGQDNGVLVVLAVKEHKVRIEVGYGLEGAITDGTSGEIIRNIMAPEFRSGRFGAGLVAGVKAIEERIPPSGVKKAEKRRRGLPPARAILFGLFIIFMILSRLFTPRGPMGLGGGPYIGGFGGGFGGGGFGGGFGGGDGGCFGGFGGGGSGGGGAGGDW